MKIVDMRLYRMDPSDARFPEPAECCGEKVPYRLVYMLEVTTDTKEVFEVPFMITKRSPDPSPDEIHKILSAMGRAIIDLEAKKKAA